MRIALDFLTAGGKRLRPRLCAAVYRAAAPHGTDDLSPLLEAIECFHKASLIHDDIQDGDDVRSGRPTVWKAHGIPVAIAAGDWLVAHGYALITASAYPRVREMVSACAASHLRLCEGQADELTHQGDYISICARKTGEGFALAASLGALAAGVDPTPYRTWGLTYGILFQIEDDLTDRGETAQLLELRATYRQKLKELPVGPFEF